MRERHVVPDELFGINQVRGKSISKIFQLFQIGAELNVKQNSGDTPLGLAVMRGHPGVDRLLLEQGADPNIAGNHGSPLAIARGRNQQEMIALLERPADQFQMSYGVVMQIRHANG